MYYYSKASISRTSLSRNPLYLELILRSLELPYTLALAFDPLSRTSLSRKTVYLEVKSLVPQAEFIPLSRSRSISRVINWCLYCLFNRETAISTCVLLSAPSTRSVHAFTAFPKAEGSVNCNTAMLDASQLRNAWGRVGYKSLPPPGTFTHLSIIPQVGSYRF